MATLTLGASGPTPDPLTATNGESITITNDWDEDIVLTLSIAGLLNPSQGTSLTVPAAGWNGTVGTTSGSYDYVEPSRERAPRNGSINVG